MKAIRDANYDSLSPELHQLVKRAWEVRCQNFPPVVQFDLPRQTTVVSLTGDKCSLNCAHCGGHYLKKMTPIEQAMAAVKAKRSTSCLISGGCNHGGSLDFGHHLDQIGKLKEAGRKLNMHVGLVSDSDMDRIARLADCVSFDFVVDDDTIKEVYGLECTGKDYIETYRKLRNVVKVLPHVCIGLKGGEIKGEYAALDKLQELGTEGLVFIVFTPTPGTRYTDRKPTPFPEVVRLLAMARIDFPSIPIHLGCMRPKGRLRAEIDYYAIECGVNKLVNPTGQAIKRAGELGLEIRYGEECCVL